MRRTLKLVTPAAIAAAALLALAVAPAAQASVAATKFPYTYTNPDGTKVVIHSEPKRVVLDGGIGPDGLLSLKVKFVGGATFNAGVGPYRNFDGQLTQLNGGELNGIENVGAYESPDYEAIAALHPDLIITQSDFPPTEILQLSTIATTIQASDEPPTNAPVLSDQYFWENSLRQVAPIFNAVGRFDQVIARLKQRETALAGFARGTSVAQIIAYSATSYSLVNSDQDLGGLLQLAGMKVQPSLAGGTPNSPQFTQFSDEELPNLTAQKDLFVGVTGGPPSVPTIEADPLFPKIPAFATHQTYFTGWFNPEPVGTADALSQLQTQMFGVSGLEATLMGTGKERASRSGVADVDVSPTAKRVCWAISTTGSVGHPNSVAVTNAKGTVDLFSLGKGYHRTGCVNVKGSAARKLLSSPNYRVSIDKVTGTKTTTVLLRGAIGKQSPGFFGYNGKDTLVTNNAFQ